MAITWTYETAFHLLVRAGFGHNGKLRKNSDEASLVRKLADKTQADAVEYILDIHPNKRRGPGRTNSDGIYWDKLQKWWFDRMFKARKGAYEKTVLFLHTHFATARSTVDKSLYMAVQNALFRELAFGDFRALVKRVNVDPAMLWWLNGDVNTAASPNENYAREVQQLFVLGPIDFHGNRNYSQADIATAARVLTGWQRNEPQENAIESYFTFSRHTKTAKTLYVSDPVETPNMNPANQYTIDANTTDAALAATEHEIFTVHMFSHLDTDNRPTAARFIARRMWKFFAYEPDVDLSAGTGQQDLPMIDALANTFKGPDLLGQEYNIKNLLRAMFLRDEFYADTTRTIKGPVEYIIGATRMLGGKLRRDKKDVVVPGTGGELADMGQELLNPPDVFSWRGNFFWITTQTLLARYDYASDLADGTRSDDLGYKVEKLLGVSAAIPDPSQTTRALVVDRFLKLLLANPAVVSAAARDELIASMDLTDPINLQDFGVQNQVRGMIKLILTMPHFHVH